MNTKEIVMSQAYTALKKDRDDLRRALGLARNDLHLAREKNITIRGQICAWCVCNLTHVASCHCEDDT